MNTMKKNIDQKMIHARAAMVLDHPFFGHLALRMKFVEDGKCDTAWTDGKILAYNPHYVKILPFEKLKGLIAHVVMHPACRHHLRRNGRDPGMWNMACDYAINWILLEAGLVLPDGFLDDPDLHGKTADEIYVRLEADRSGKKSNASDNTHEKHSSHDGEPIDLPDDAGRPGMQHHHDEADASEDDTDAIKTPDSQKENPDPQALSQGDPGRSGEVRDAPPPEASAGGMGEETPDESQWRINLAQAARRARSMGDLPAGLARFIQSLLSPKLDWRQLLYRFIQASARCDYAWMPPNRRYLHQGLYMPAMQSRDLPEAVVAIDTSGSVTAGELDQFAAELSAILETCVQSVHLLYCDTQVVRAENVRRQDLPLSVIPMGGGGTDFRPAFEWVAQHGISPLCMIYLTDLACNRFPDEPAYPVLWATIGDETLRTPFGERVHIR